MNTSEFDTVVAQVRDTLVEAGSTFRQVSSMAGRARKAPKIRRPRRMIRQRKFARAWRRTVLFSGAMDSTREAKKPTMGIA